MGQRIEVLGVDLIDDVAIFDTDRSFGGMEGETYTTLDETDAAGTYPAALAGRILRGDAGVRSVFVYSNVVSVSRAEGWTEEAADRVASEIGNFFIVYDENKNGAGQVGTS